MIPRKGCSPSSDSASAILPRPPYFNSIGRHCGRRCRSEWSPSASALPLLLRAKPTAGSIKVSARHRDHYILRSSSQWSDWRVEKARVQRSIRRRRAPRIFVILRGCTFSPYLYRAHILRLSYVTRVFLYSRPGFFPPNLSDPRQHCTENCNCIYFSFFPHFLLLFFQR